MGFVLLTGEKLLSCSGLLTCYESYQMTTHRSEVVPEYEPGGTGGEADTADDKVEQTDDKKACTAGNTKHRDQGFSPNLERGQGQGEHSEDYWVQLRRERGVGQRPCQEE